VATLALVLMAGVPALARGGYRSALEELISFSFLGLLIPWSVGLALARPGAAPPHRLRGAALIEGLGLGGIVAGLGLPLGLGLLARRPPEPALLGFLLLFGLAQAAAVFGAVRVRREADVPTRSRGLFMAGAVLGAVPFVFLAIGQLVGFHAPSNTESHAVGDLRTIVSAQAAYESASGGQYGSLECLVRPQPCLSGYPPGAPPFLDGTYLQPVRRGYRFVFHGGPKRFAVTAEPLHPGRTGIRIFCADSTGEVRSGPEGPLPPLIDGLCPPAMAPLR
jgi:hypothetical protein